MSAASNALENHILNGTLRGYASAYTAPAATDIKLALFSGPASDVLAALEAGTAATTIGNWGYYEINNGTYSRTQITFGTDTTTGSISNTANCTFPTATANYDNTAGSGSTITCIAIIDESRTPDQVMYYGLLSNSKEILNGDTFQVATGNLTISLA
jgi:hypothetical protein